MGTQQCSPVGRPATWVRATSHMFEVIQWKEHVMCGEAEWPIGNLQGAPRMLAPQ
jgi:hypothetical protein